MTEDKMRHMYRKMLEIRTFEEEIHYLFLQGELSGTIHQYQGQEAVAVGVCAALSSDDFILSTHRSHGHSIAKGMSMREIMAELYAKRTGCCKGKGGSMHIGNISKGVLPANAIVGANIPIASGVALALKCKQNRQVAVSFFGDGASNEGAFHEGINFAAVQKLPVIFVCENNLYGCQTSVRRVLAIDNVADRAAAYGIKGIVADGNDMIAVYECAAAAVEHARSGKGPTLIEYKTYRHCGHSRSDPANYRPEEELKKWQQHHDPLILMQKRLLDQKILDRKALEQLKKEVTAELQDAIEFARGEPSPSQEEVFDDVYR